LYVLAVGAGIVYFHHKGVFDPTDRALSIAPPQRE